MSLSKRQKLSIFYFEDLPDEILLKIVSFLNMKGVLQCGQVSKRLRAISNDQCLWLKLNLSGREVPYDFIEKAIQNGCEYLNLGYCHVHRGEKSKMPWKLKYLEISQSGGYDGEGGYMGLMGLDPGVLENCNVLQKLAMDYLKLDSDEIQQICQNGETLRMLSLEGCSINYDQRTELIQKLFTECHQLTELNISNPSYPVFRFEDPHVCALIDNLTPNILKLNLGYQEGVKDEHVNTLVCKCKKITELNLSGTSITNNSMESIIKHLNSLEKLDVEHTNIDISTLLKLKSMTTLKILRCFSQNTDKIKNLKLQLPQVSINEEYLCIACPRKLLDGSIEQDRLWEIRACKYMFNFNFI